MSKPDKQGRHHLHIELTPAQYQSLTAQAKRCGLTKRAYLVRIIEGNPVRARPAKEIKELRTEIHHIGNNINQIARNTNAKKSTGQEDIDAAVRLAYQVMGLVKETL